MASTATATIRAILEAQAILIEEECETLGNLDAALGDGDLGVSMIKAFKAILRRLTDSELVNATPATLIIAAGREMTEAAPSTFGTLLGLAIVEGGKAMGADCEIGLTNLTRFWTGVADAIGRYGKARVGDKTVLDVLVPVIDVFHCSEREGLPLDRAVVLARERAQTAYEACTLLRARHGRAARYGERSAGHPDPGALVGVLLIQGFARVLAP